MCWRRAYRDTHTHTIAHRIGFQFSAENLHASKSRLHDLMARRLSLCILFGNLPTCSNSTTQIYDLLGEPIQWTHATATRAATATAAYTHIKWKFISTQWNTETEIVWHFPLLICFWDKIANAKWKHFLQSKRFSIVWNRTFLFVRIAIHAAIATVAFLLMSQTPSHTQPQHCINTLSMQ